MADEWQDIATARHHDEPFIAAIYVIHNPSGHGWWEQHIIYLDDETGDVHADCEQGWSLADYVAWMPLPSPPIARRAE